MFDVHIDQNGPLHGGKVEVQNRSKGFCTFGGVDGSSDVLDAKKPALAPFLDSKVLCASVNVARSTWGFIFIGHFSGCLIVHIEHCWTCGWMLLLDKNGTKIFGRFSCVNCSY